MPSQWSSKEWLEQKLKKPHKWPMLACYPRMVKSGPNAGDTLHKKWSGYTSEITRAFPPLFLR
jgi:hypothetical protein